MANLSLEPYLFFKGDCAQAMEFYKKIFGGELFIQKIEEVPQDMGPTMKDFQKDWIMHASLKGEVNLMASDSPLASPQMKKVSLSIGGTDEPKMRQIFEGLAENGKVTSPLKKEFWGDIFGSLTDRFGVDWMFNIGSEKKG